MNLSLGKNVSTKFTSKSQKIRVLSEGWFSKEAYCPNCGHSKIEQYPNNKPVADFFCAKCSEDFELKSKKGKIGKTVPAGAYSKMIERIASTSKPNFFFIGYLSSMEVNDFFAIPKHFFIPDVIEKRKALAKTARRAGWVGANILLSKIPKAGQIFYIENGKNISKKEVLKKWQKTVFLKQIKNVNAKGWVLDIMNCIDILQKKEFSLEDIYQFESELAKIYPENRHIKPKIRQQLQVLRDSGYLEFRGNGIYKLR